MGMIYDDDRGVWVEDPNDMPPQADGVTPAPGPTTPPPAAQTADQQAVIDYYKKYLGRDPKEGDVDKWLSGTYGWGGAGNLSGIETGIRMSDEAARNRSNNPSTSFSGTPYTGFQTTGNDYSAFNVYGREQNPGKSAKDAFAYISNTAPAPPFGDKNALNQWFKTYIEPGMTALGHKVSSSNGDGFDYENAEGKFHVDFTQNAGAPGGLRRLQWNATPADAATAARYGQSGGAASGSGGMGFGGGGGGGGYGGGSGAQGFPMLDVPSYEAYPEWVPEEWVAPKPEDVYNDPSYQFRYDEGMKPITNANALAGLSRSGATMKALSRYGQNFASNEFDRIYGRAADTYDRRNRVGYQAWTANAGEHHNKYNMDVNEATLEFQPRWDAAKLQFDRDFDLYKYQNDDAYRYWSTATNAASSGAHLYDSSGNEP